MESFLGSKQKIVKDFFPTIIHCFFFLIFSSISLLNHYYFRSVGLDYGLANQALYEYAHFKTAIITQLISGEPSNFLGCHLSFWVLLLSPFYWIFGSYTLLIFQNFMLIFAGIGILKIAKYFKMNEWVMILVLLQFYTSFAIYSAIAFDYHDNVIGACFLPWLFYFYQKEKIGLTILCFFAILISKENLAILLIFVAFTLWLSRPNFNWKSFQIPLLLFIIAISYFFLAILVVIPSLNGSGNFDQIGRYSHLGSSLSEIFKYIITHPIKMLQLFYESHIEGDNESRVKQEFLFVLLLSGGIALIRKPAFLWMVLPILIQKLWNKELAFWGLSYHYQIEIAPIVSLAILFWLKDINSWKIQISIIGVLLITTFSICFLKMHSRYSEYYHPYKENLFTIAHYQAPEGFQKIKAGIAKIPADSAVCAQANLLPHLSNRDKIYHFPYINDARYFLFLQPQLNAYPETQDRAEAIINGLRESGEWIEDSTFAPLRILTRK